MKVVGRSGAVMDLPEQLARAMIRNGSVEPVEEPGQVAAPGSPPPAEPVVEVADYAAAGRTTQPQPEPAATRPKAGAAEVRAWAAANGIDCPAKGKPPLKVVQAYLRAHKEE